MLTIRDEQLAALRRPAVERFVERTLAALPEIFPGDPRLEDAAALRALVEAGVAGALALGLGGGREVTLYVCLFVEHGAGFEDAPATSWMGRTLRNPALHDAAKLDLIYARLEAAERGAGT